MQKPLKLNRVPSLLGSDSDDSSASTDSAAPALTPSPHRILRRLSRRRSSAPPSCLQLPNLDHEEPPRKKRVSLWNSTFMRACLGIILAAYLFGNLNILYGIPTLLWWECMTVATKWMDYFSHDSHVLKAKYHFRHHWKRATLELERTKKGGWVRRRQEIVASNISYRFMYYVSTDLWEKRYLSEQRKHLAHLQARVASLRGDE